MNAGMFSFSPMPGSDRSQSVNPMMAQSLFAGGGSGGLPDAAADHYEQTSKLRMQLDAANKEVQQLRQERDVAHVQHANTEYMLAETHAALAVAQRTVREAEDALEAHVAATAAQVATLQKTLKAQTTRVGLSSLVDRAIFSLFVEVRFMLAERGECPPLTAADVEELRCLPIVGVIAELQLWCRHLVGMTQDAASAAYKRQTFADMSGRQATDRRTHPPPLLAKGVSMDASLNHADALGETGGQLSPGRKKSVVQILKPSSSSSSSSAAASPADAAGGGGHSRRQMAKETSILAEAPFDATVGSGASFGGQQPSSFAGQPRASSVFGRQSRGQSVSSACDGAHLQAQLRESTAEVQLLKEKLRDQGKDLIVRVQLEHQVKDLRAQLDAGARKVVVTEQECDNAVDAYKRHSTAIIRQLNEKIQLFEEMDERRRDNQAVVQDALFEAKSAKAQLSRSNVKVNEDKCKRLEAVLHARDKDLHTSRQASQQLESSLRVLQSSHDKVIAEYNAIFHKHVEAQLSKAKVAQMEEAKRTEQATLGTDSGVTVHYLRTRYQEVQTELRHAQKKIRQLIVLSHHDQLTFNLQHQDLEAQLKNEKDEVAILSRRAEDIRSRFDAHDDDDDVGGTSFATHKAQLAALKVLQQPSEDASVIQRGNQTIISEGGAVTEHSMELVSSADHAFASPLETSTLARMRSLRRATFAPKSGDAAMQGGEVSLRSASMAHVGHGGSHASMANMSGGPSPSFADAAPAAAAAAGNAATASKSAGAFPAPEVETVAVFRVKAQSVVGKRTVTLPAAHAAVPAGAMLGRPSSATPKGHPGSMTPVPRPGSAML